MEKANKGVVIYGVLNWGIGHATRSVPVLRALIENGFTPVIASDGAALKYLEKEFPQLKSENLTAYNIRYSESGNLLTVLFGQLPKILRAQRKERQVLKKLVKKYNPVGIISDNRLGFYHSKTPSVYITHQLKIMLPFLRNFISRRHHHFINKFDECWIPDVDSSENISGEMGHSLMPKAPVKYIGVLSRFSDLNPTLAPPQKYNAAAILSGPEPQRSILETRVVSQMGKLEGKFLLIRGSTENGILEYPKNIEVQNFASKGEISEAVLASKMIISRAGYSSLMDYYFLKNKALLIPTPGQPEQEYLARYHMHTGRFLYSSQEFLNLEKDLAEAENYRGFAGGEQAETNWEELFTFFQRKRKS